jgi:hypothetical protein
LAARLQEFTERLEGVGSGVAAFVSPPASSGVPPPRIAAGVGASDNPRMNEDELHDRVRETEAQLEDAEKRLEDVEAQIDEAREHAGDA